LIPIVLLWQIWLLLHQDTIHTIQSSTTIREGDFATKGEGSTLFKYIKEGLKIEKASFKNWWVSAGSKKVKYHPGCFEVPSN
jgi:hypothetical protein